MLGFPASTKTEAQGTQPASAVSDISKVSGFRAICSAVDMTTPQTPLDQMNTSFCLGWVHGLSAGITVANLYTIGKIQICFPVGNSFGQMLHVIKKYIDDHPEQEHLNTEFLAYSALMAAFPCQK